MSPTNKRAEAAILPTRQDWIRQKLAERMPPAEILAALYHGHEQDLVLLTREVQTRSRAPAPDARLAWPEARKADLLERCKRGEDEGSIARALGLPRNKVRSAISKYVPAELRANARAGVGRPGVRAGGHPAPLPVETPVAEEMAG